jgi:1-deoxy-D-xylulose-5-phosphate reductoisomerase
VKRKLNLVFQSLFFTIECVLSQGSTKQNLINKSKVLILGATGSVGESTLDVLRQHSNRFEVVALTANKNYQLLLKQCLEFRPQQVVLVDEQAAQDFKKSILKQSPELAASLKVRSGKQALLDIAKDSTSDVVMAAIVGAAGLAATFAAAQAGKRILLANKESLVMSGKLFMEAVQSSGAQLLPIDSEHNAIFQCLPIANQKPEIQALAHPEIKRIILTASGGPFWERDQASFASISPDEACKHPKWEMGRKISVDSATLMNKGLEVIEACLLFDLKPEQVEVIIHPQSIVHSMVEYIDGSVIAQMANPDMKIPIAYGLSWPERIDSGVNFLDLVQIEQLSFYKPDLNKFPCLALAYQALSVGPSAMVTLNAANEIAVQAFLDGTLTFEGIPKVIEQTLNVIIERKLPSLESVFALDSEVREIAANELLKLSSRHS